MSYSAPPDLLAIALELHSDRWGSSDSYAHWCQPPGTRTEHLRLLRERLASWRPSPLGRAAAFDEAVRQVLQAAVDEWEGEPDTEVVEAVAEGGASSP